MMISPSKYGGPALRELPFEVVTDLLKRGERGVSPLEFLCLDDISSTKKGSRSDAEESVLHLAALEHSANATRTAFERERQIAIDEATQALQLEFERVLVEERSRVDLVCSLFGRDRQRYFAAAETQVVKLALAIARRVLTREISEDGLHLAATVRSALAKVQDGSATVLRVNPFETASWKRLFLSEGETRVEVLEDHRIAVGECVLETEVGRVELGVGAQMKEIERGFTELMQRQSE